MSIIKNAEIHLKPARVCHQKHPLAKTGQQNKTNEAHKTHTHTNKHLKPVFLLTESSQTNKGNHNETLTMKAQREEDHPPQNTPHKQLRLAGSHTRHETKTKPNSRLWWASQNAILAPPSLRQRVPATWQERCCKVDLSETAQPWRRTSSL